MPHCGAQGQCILDSLLVPVCRPPVFQVRRFMFRSCSGVVASTVSWRGDRMTERGCQRTVDSCGEAVHCVWLRGYAHLQVPIDCMLSSNFSRDFL